jgi:hypothetical protein|tara:strand:+ start:192 stop:716 length:525 start_codon:yes stop_codon:yes gene_type:complete
MAKKKVTHKFKTKRKEGTLFMICRNSIDDPTFWGHQFLGDKPRCNEWVEVGQAVTATLCHRCVNKTVGPPEIKGGYVSKGRIRGWQFMKEFVDPQGNVFHKGKEQPKLKGTLNPTEPKPTKKKLSKQEKADLKASILEQMLMLRGRVKKATLKKDIKSNSSQLKKLERQLKKIR